MKINEPCKFDHHFLPRGEEDGSIMEIIMFVVALIALITLIEKGR